MKRISLFGRKRISELTHESDTAQVKRDELLALKLNQLEQSAKAKGELLSLPIFSVHPDPHQPRKTFKNIESLAKSIKEKGVISPIIVCEDGPSVPRQYKIIAGERRYRAAQQAGLDMIPCLCRAVDDENVLLLQILENDQRESVSPLEEAQAIIRLLEEKKMSKAAIANALGRDAPWLSIRLGLLQASPEIKNLVSSGLIEDVRTLHELRMFEREFPREAKDLIWNIQNERMVGGHREIIASSRRALKADKTAPKRARESAVRLSLDDNMLVIQTRDSKVYRFEVVDKVLESFIASVETVS